MTHKTARIVFMGPPAFAAPPLDAPIKAGHEAPPAVTQPDKPSGRGQRNQSCPVKELATQNNIPVLQPAKVREEGFIESLRGLKPAFIAVGGSRRILPPP